MRRLLRVLIVIGVLAAMIMAWMRRARSGVDVALPDLPAADVALPDIAPARVWTEPLDGACPDGFPVKAKLSSGIFHLPGMVNYARTTPDRCYTSAEAAAADGLRPAKR
jgi:hypothetical protein